VNHVDFWQAVLEFAIATTSQVGQQLLQEFGHAKATEKADGSLVTGADCWADSALREAIAAAFPTHGILSEEGTHTFPNREWCWIIDPIDGTTNFARGIPLWGISLGLLYRGTPIFGYIHLPPIGQSFHGFWYGTSGLTGPVGAFLQNQRIHTSSAPMGPNECFSLCARSSALLKQPFPCKARMLGVATYNLLIVAAGVALGGVEATPKIWDIAATWVVMQAAGGVWIPLNTRAIFPLQAGENYGQQPYPTLVVSRPELVPVFQPLVQEVLKS